MISEIFEKNKSIIINTDIDGFLCGEILRHYFGCKIVGFSNSKKEIWVAPEVESIYDPVYIDLFVARQDVVCIDQHIIAQDASHHRLLKNMGTKLNPNIERNRTFEGDYYHKYPFGTVHYIIALMAREGINVELPNLSSKVYNNGIDLNTELGQVILRADDALYSTLSAYADNALDWWKYLDSENKYPTIQKFVEYIKTCDRSKAKEYKDSIGRMFKNNLYCDGADGAFTYITDSNGRLQDRVNNLWNVICKSLNFENGNVHPLPQNLILHKGRFVKSIFRPGSNGELFNSSNLFSYAFIYGPHSKYPNFSYTLDMKD